MAATAAHAQRTPTNEEIALLVLANQSRANPAADGGTEPAVQPMMWNDQLAAAAQAHSDDMAENGCFQHNSCNGRSWSRRIGSYYPSWHWLGENIAAGITDPRGLHNGWMHSTGHRANILAGGFNEFGAAMAIGESGFGALPLATEDFGMRGIFSALRIATLPAGCVLPRQAPAGTQRELLVNYFYSGDGPARSVRAIVGSQCVDMQLAQGTATNGTYRAARSFSGNGCIPTVFEAIRADGSRHRWPESGAILLGIGSTSCAERTNELPAASCGGSDPLPTPTPTAAPTPTPGASPEPEDLRVSEARVVLKPGVANASKGKVQMKVSFVAPAGFDPRSGDVAVRVAFGGNGEWTMRLPASCNGKPCLSRNAKGSQYTATYGRGGPVVAFARAKSGKWTLRFNATNQTLSRVSPGPVELDVEVSGLSASAGLTGEVRDKSLVAD